MTARNTDPGGLGINGVIPGDGRCVVATCEEPSRPDALMCRMHWWAVPRHLRSDLVDVAARWKRGDGTLSDVRAVQWACVDAVSPAGTS